MRIMVVYEDYGSLCWGLFWAGEMLVFYHAVTEALCAKSPEVLLCAWGAIENLPVVLSILKHRPPGMVSQVRYPCRLSSVNCSHVEYNTRLDIWIYISSTCQFIISFPFLSNVKLNKCCFFAQWMWRWKLNIRQPILFCYWQSNHLRLEQSQVFKFLKI